jgi:maltose O-acetyltransferase
LPSSDIFLVGRASTRIRNLCCKNLFAKCGEGVNVEHGAVFGNGMGVEIGDYSGIGINANIDMATIGRYVMMGPDVIILSTNHRFDDVNLPMGFQGFGVSKRVIIEDDCWIGARTIILPGRRIGKGAVVGAGSVVTKDVPPFAVVAGNPAAILKYRT